MAEEKRELKLTEIGLCDLCAALVPVEEIETHQQFHSVIGQIWEVTKIVSLHLEALKRRMRSAN